MLADGVISDINQVDVNALNHYIHLRPGTERKCFRGEKEHYQNVSASANLSRSNSKELLQDTDTADSDKHNKFTAKFSRNNNSVENNENLPPIPKNNKKKRGVNKNMQFENATNMSDDEYDLNDRI